MEKYSLIIVGGGAAGLFLASSAELKNGKILILERGERLGRKLSATGNGQGNLTNEKVGETPYFSFSENGNARVQEMLSRHGKEEMLAFLEGLGGIFLPDERGRFYPAGRQASSITDLLRFEVARRGVEVKLGCFVSGVEKRGEVYLVTAQTPDGERVFAANNIAVCTGGKAAKNFGSDGNGYEIVKRFSHTLTPLYPALVQLKTETKHIKMLKGIRVGGALVTALVEKTPVASVQGDIIFTDYGVSGDAIFRISSFIADKIGAQAVSLKIDLLPSVSAEKLASVLESKQRKYPNADRGELLCGILNNQVGRAVMKRCLGEPLSAAVACVKAFALPVSGTLGFDYAQVTKGGVCFDEVDENLQSKFSRGLYFGGEILDIDGECGGFNLQWAYTSARVIAESLKSGGQV
ncbi:MAG: aminoacetone oxidase family FAD-binding enzyme [Clostridia bacterium]|nr:aminoacetone oxidase family FAD-binding enzyme [Clostridia bacterium]